jgi:hypothetical protein
MARQSQVKELALTSQIFMKANPTAPASHGLSSPQVVRFLTFSHKKQKTQGGSHRLRFTYFQLYFSHLCEILHKQKKNGGAM